MTPLNRFKIALLRIHEKKTKFRVRISSDKFVSNRTKLKVDIKKSQLIAQLLEALNYKKFETNKNSRLTMILIRHALFKKN